MEKHSPTDDAPRSDEQQEHKRDAERLMLQQEAEHLAHAKYRADSKAGLDRRRVAVPDLANRRAAAPACPRTAVAIVGTNHVAAQDEHEHWAHRPEHFRIAPRKQSGAYHPEALLTGTELEHAHGIINELTTLIRERLTPPMRFVKLEGDAVFC